MRLLKTFKKKPLTRLELKGHSKNSKFRVRASRTSGLNAAFHPFRGLTFNTKHGLRASKTFKGLTLGFQRGNSVVRGRWSSTNGLMNLNLSKSGFSLSSKSKYGTYNFTNPNRSSFKFGGIQLRGKNAKGLAFIATIFTLIPVLLKAIIMLPIVLFRLIEFIYFVSILIIKVIINIFIILWRVFLLIYHFGLLVLIDLPKQILNNIAQREIFDVSNKYNDEVEQDKILESDADQINNLRRRLSKYTMTYKEVSISKKIMLAMLAMIGVLVIVVGLIIFSVPFLSESYNNIPLIMFSISLAIFLFFLGKLSITPWMQLRQQKLDEEFKEILGI